MATKLTSDVQPLEDSTALLASPDQLRGRARRDGYLFFRGLLDADAVLGLRRAALGVLERHGLGEPGVLPLGGKLDLERLNAIPDEEMRVDIGVTHQMYFELQQLPELHRLPRDPALVGMYRTLFGEEVFVHPRHIMRAMTPHPAGGPTPPHQDFPLIQGSAETWTAWFPVGDCPIALGPLVVLRGSHRNGYLPIAANEYAEEEGWADWGVQLCEQDNDWVGGDVEVGDVLTFSCFTAHRSLRPVIRDEIRLSMDVRYQRASDIINEGSLTNHSAREWDEVYAGWTEADRDLMYYWKDVPLKMSDFDASLLDPGARRIC